MADSFWQWEEMRAACVMSSPFPCGSVGAGWIGSQVGLDDPEGLFQLS